jgi:hypothetical protein
MGAILPSAAVASAPCSISVVHRHDPAPVRQILPRSWLTSSLTTVPRWGFLVGRWSSPSPSGGPMGPSRPTVFGEANDTNSHLLEQHQQRRGVNRPITRLNGLRMLSRWRGRVAAREPFLIPRPRSIVTRAPKHGCAMAACLRMLPASAWAQLHRTSVRYFMFTSPFAAPRTVPCEYHLDT